MPTTIDIHELQQPIFWGGQSDEVQVEPLTDEEQEKLQAFYDMAKEALSMYSVKLVNLFEAHTKLIEFAVMLAKAKLITSQSAVFGGLQPRSGQLGITFLEPAIIKYDASVPTIFSSDNWQVTLNQGYNYILGSSSDYYFASSTPSKGFVGMILPMGLLEFGSEPTLLAVRHVGQGGGANPPYTLIPVAEIPIERDTNLYVYSLHYAHPLLPDFGTKLIAKAAKDATTVIKLLGVAVYETGFIEQVFPAS